ncbi:MAG: DRTGG domain-containing protein [Desulfobacterales bacterium]|nr:DRTGG domain-containing protein [Desulfobacterales bacterium]
MLVKDLVDKFDLEVAGGQQGLDREVNEGYCGDLLSEIMGNAPIGCAWLTIQGHQNIVAVAVLREMAAIIITSGQKPDAETIQKADQEGIPILQWPDSSFQLAGRLFSAGIGNTE